MIAYMHSLLLLLTAWQTAQTAGKGFLHSSQKLGMDAVGSGHGSELGSGDSGGYKSVSTTFQKTLEAMVGDSLFHGTGGSLNDIANIGQSKIPIDDAVRQLDGKLPSDVQAFLKLTRTGHNRAAATLDETSMQKARKILNNMIYGAWLELDDVVFELKEFQERNRGTYEQVVSDLARLGSQLAKLGQAQAAANQGIAAADVARKKADARMVDIKAQFMANRFENAREMSIRKNDLAVCDCILNATACKDGAASFLQHEGHQPQVMLCDGKGGLELNFNNPQLQAKVELMMTPAARVALREALGQVEVEVPSHTLALLGTGEHGASSETTRALPTFASAVHEVMEAPPPGSQSKKCVDGTPHCGLLHDSMWWQCVKFKDGFDELTHEMSENQQEYDKTARNINDELTMINDDKTKQTEVLAATVSSINADTEEMNEKDEQKRALTHEFDTTFAQFKAKISEILFTKVCAVRKVRNELLLNSKVTPPSQISDCAFSDWASKTGECMSEAGTPILCDDTCPRKDPYKCGGKEVMKRDVIVIPNDNGMKCPPLLREKLCAQKKCPVDCVMSAWSGWSKCTKDCEGGVQAKTRAILAKPKNGGVSCDAVQEDRPCNTGSCDRDCTLSKWGKWAPCSMACGGGSTSRTKKVLVPIRGQGKCPKPTASERLEEQACNTQACNGDEICIAQQDLILMIDASGSLKKDGFDVMRTFAATLTKRYKAKYFGKAAVNIGIVLYGNGRLVSIPEGGTSVEPAINIQGLTDDLDLVRQEIGKLKWQRGFTNMAQGFALADTMLGQGGRAGAQSAVLVLSTGKYSFKFQTAEKAQELKDKNVKIFMAPVTDRRAKELDELKHWASAPWSTHYEWIPGLMPIKFNADIFIQKLVAKFCPDSFSPSTQGAIDNLKQYLMVHEGGMPNTACAKKVSSVKAGSTDDCAAAARSANKSSFAIGVTSQTQGQCHVLDMYVSRYFYDASKKDRTNIPCPAPGGGAWDENGMFDTYMINPDTI